MFDIGIIGAMAPEVEGLVSALSEKKEQTFSGITFYCGVLEGKRVVIARCGIGKVFAAICAQTMILNYAPRLIVNTGVGGAVAAGLSTGDVVIAESLVQHDMDTSALGDPVGLISGINIVNIPADARVAETLAKGGETLENIKAVKGVIASGDQFIASAEKKQFIVGNFDAIVCEMEGASIAQVCFTNGVPFGVVRAVSDCADGSSHMDYREFLPVAAANAAKLIEYFVMNT